MNNTAALEERHDPLLINGLLFETEVMREQTSTEKLQVLVKDIPLNTENKSVPAYIITGSMK